MLKVINQASLVIDKNNQRPRMTRNVAMNAFCSDQRRRADISRRKKKHSLSTLQLPQARKDRHRRIDRIFFHSLCSYRKQRIGKFFTASSKTSFQLLVFGGLLHAVTEQTRQKKQHGTPPKGSNAPHTRIHQKAEKTPVSPQPTQLLSNVPLRKSSVKTRERRCIHRILENWEHRQ